MLTLGFSPYGHMWGNIKPFDKLFKKKKSITEGLKGIDCLVLWGGTDINSAYYGKKPNGFNQQPNVDRDEVEYKAMQYCLTHEIPMVGVCRGAQFGCVFSGGTLVQDTNGHNRDHQIETDEGKILWTTSSHHQMMYPFDVPHKMLAWTHPEPRSTYYDGEDGETIDMKDKVEPEVVYFPQTKFLAIQGHPEWGTATPDFQDYCCNMVSKYLLNKE